MSLKQLVKKYPVTIITALLISISLSILFFESKVYGATSTPNPDCMWRRIQCSTFQNPDKKFICEGDPNDNAPPCICIGISEYKVCDIYDRWECVPKNSGCGGPKCDQPRDCDNSHTQNKNCGDCYIYKLDKEPCTIRQGNNTCDKCVYNKNKE